MAQELQGDFDKDVPEEIQKNVMEMIVEAAHDPDNRADDITFIDVEQLNVTNVEATGIIEINGVEHSFHIRSGDWNGTELISWNKDTEIDRSPRTPDALVPHRNRIQEAIVRGSARRFLEDWNADLRPGSERGDQLHDLLSKRAYDRFFDPNPSAYRYDAVASELGYDVDDASVEKKMRALLHFHITTVMPTHEFFIGKSSIDALQEWNGALDKEGDFGKIIHDIRLAAAMRLASSLPDTHTGARETYPSQSDQSELEKLSYRLVDPENAHDKRRALLLEIFRLEKIDGFDPADLPENPISALFQALDPDLVSGTKVDALKEACDTVVRACDRLAWGTDLELPQSVHDRLSTFGYRVVSPELTVEPASEDGFEMT